MACDQDRAVSLRHAWSWHRPFVDWGTGAGVLGIPPSHLPQRQDALQPMLLEVAHRLGLPGSAGTVASGPGFDDTEVPVAVARVHAPGVEPGRGGWQQDLTGELVGGYSTPCQDSRAASPSRAARCRFRSAAANGTWLHGARSLSTIARTSP